MSFKRIVFFLGVYLLLVSFFSFLNILYSIYFNFNLDLFSYIAVLALSLGIGISFCFFGKNYNKNILFREQIILIFLSFLFIPLILSIPFFYSSYDISLLDSYFESISGFTATGFSIIEEIEEIDEPLILWRSSSQWLGGLIFLTTLFGTLGLKKNKFKPVYLILFEEEAGNFYNNFNSNLIKITLIYVILTILILVSYKITNIRFFDAFNLAMTTISAGGFLSKNELSGITSNNIQILIFSLSLLIPIFNFYLLLNIATFKFSLSNHREDLHLTLIILLSTFLLYFLITPNEDLAKSLLAVVSALSTSGLSIYSSDKDLSLFFILISLLGGSVVSTSSGLKYVRFYILLKTSYQEIYKLVKPNNVFNRNLFTPKTRILDEDSRISFFIFISFIISMFFLSCILSLDSLTFENAFKLSILTLTNTTNSVIFGLDNINFIDLNSLTKINLIFFMVLGKIEIIALFYLFKITFFKE